MPIEADRRSEAGRVAPSQAAPDARTAQAGPGSDLIRSRQAMTMVIALTALLTAIDFGLPRNINIAIFYVVPILLCARTRSIAFLWIMVAVCIVLSYLGIAIGPAPPPGSGASAVPNRLIVDTALIIMGTIIQQRILGNRRLDAVQRLLAERNETLRDSETRFRATFEQAAIGITHADLRGRFLRVNDRVCQLTGYSRDELLSISFRDITYPEDLGPQLKLHSALVNGEIPSFQSEKRYLRKDGTIVWINLAVSLIRRHTGEPDYLIAIIEDISARKNAEAALHAIRDQLERRVASEVEERLRTEATLRQAQKMEALGQLTGGIAHDFNNILTTIVGNLERIGESVPSEDRRKRFVDTALQSADHGAQLTKQLLSFARRQRLEPIVVRIDHVLTEFVTFSRRAIGREIDLSLECEDGIWRCQLDTAQLQTALLNLVLNARDAMAQGGRLFVSAHNEVVGEGQVLDLAAGEYVRISVKDEGAGMTPDVLAQAFEPFYTTKETGKGSGLGLSMVYGFAKQSGGTARIASTVNVGTTVDLFLPRTLASEVQDRGARLKAQRPKRPTTILVVDDDEGVRSMSAEALRDFGYQVLEAGNGDEALAILEQEPVDLLFSDVVMPGGVSGIDLFHKARQMRGAFPVLLTTGYADSLASVPLRDTGVQVLAKPFRPSELRARIHQILSEDQPLIAPVETARDPTEWQT